LNTSKEFILENNDGQNKCKNNNHKSENLNMNCVFFVPHSILMPRIVQAIKDENFKTRMIINVLHVQNDN